jgi:PAS domain S-box-containing protein
MDELREITEHLLQFAPDALIVIDDANRIRFANETVKELFGHAPQSLVGKPLEMLIPERLRAIMAGARPVSCVVEQSRDGRPHCRSVRPRRWIVFSRYRLARRSASAANCSSLRHP